MAGQIALSCKVSGLYTLTTPPQCKNLFCARRNVASNIASTNSKFEAKKLHRMLFYLQNRSLLARVLDVRLKIKVTCLTIHVLQSMATYTVLPPFFWDTFWAFKKYMNCKKASGSAPPSVQLIEVISEELMIGNSVPDNFLPVIQLLKALGPCLSGELMLIKSAF